MHQSGHDAAGAQAGSVKTCTVGFALSILLTFLAFGLVAAGGLPHGLAVAGLFATAILQILVQLRYFLHLDRSSAMYWNVMSLLFTAFIMFLFIGGSLWIMYGLHYRM